MGLSDYDWPGQESRDYTKFTVKKEKRSSPNRNFFQKSQVFSSDSLLFRKFLE